MMKKPKILIIDDEVNWRNLLAELLGDTYLYEFADNYQQAADIIQSPNRRPMLILTDLRLSEAKDEGLKLLKEREELGIKIPTIIITGYPDESNIDESLNSYSAVGYFKKANLNIKELRDKVKDCIPVN
jgi:DNA-binding NtrC family response regulator